MTAIITVCQGDGASILSDGAQWDDDGIVIGIAPKVLLMPHLNLAVAVQGSASILNALYTYCADIVTYEEFREALPDKLRLSINLLRDECKRKGLSHTPRARLFVVGMTKSGTFESYTILSEPLDGLPAWKIIRPESWFTVTPINLDNGPIHSAAWDLFGGRSPDDFDARDALSLMEAQRREPFKLPSGSGLLPIFGVGGFCLLTRLTRTGITTEILKRWPDRIGERITP